MALLNQDASVRKPTMAEVLSSAMDARLLRLYTMLPATVTAYDAATQKVSIKPGIKESYLDEEDQRQIESLPVIPGVPVVFLGAGGFRITCPISDGNLIIEGNTVPATTGAAVFAQRSLDRWLSGSGQEVDPEIDHMHALTDAVFFPGLRPFGAALGSCPTDHMTVGADAGQQIHCHNSIVCIGDESGSQFIAMAQKVMDDFNDLKTHFDLIENAINIPTVPNCVNGSPDPLWTTLKGIIAAHAYPTPGDVAATVGKVK